MMGFIEADIWGTSSEHDGVLNPHPTHPAVLGYTLPSVVALLTLTRNSLFFHGKDQYNGSYL